MPPFVFAPKPKVFGIYCRHPQSAKCGAGALCRAVFAYMPPCADSGDTYYRDIWRLLIINFPGTTYIPKISGREVKNGGIHLQTLSVARPGVSGVAFRIYIYRLIWGPPAPHSGGNNSHAPCATATPVNPAGGVTFWAGIVTTFATLLIGTKCIFFAFSANLYYCVRGRRMIRRMPHWRVKFGAVVSLNYAPMRLLLFPFNAFLGCARRRSSGRKGFSDFPPARPRQPIKGRILSLRRNSMSYVVAPAQVSDCAAEN